MTVDNVSYQRGRESFQGGPEKPKRMRWKTYNLLMDKLVAADRLADRLAGQRLVMLAARWMKTL
jgi:hypothetical protein